MKFEQAYIPVLVYSKCLRASNKTVLLLEYNGYVRQKNRVDTHVCTSFTYLMDSFYYIDFSPLSDFAIL